MRQKNHNKEIDILMTAKHLFSLKGYKGTSMQNIAETSGLSKGTLYLYYKSKEDLFISILEHDSRRLDEQIARIDKQPNLSLKEKLAEQLKAIVHHYIDNQPFYNVHDQELTEIDNIATYQHIQNKQELSIWWLEHSLENLYGPSFKPYVTDGALTLIGITKHYLELVMTHQLPVSIDEVIPYCMDQADLIFTHYSAINHPPLFNSQLRSLMHANHSVEGYSHPLELTQALKIAVKKETTPYSNDVLESILLIEKELLHTHPNHTIIKGMIHNLREANMEQTLVDTLVDQLQLHFSR
ncbi:TetR/AcrR family transcriptional regulator [Shouchella sp. 1P09AA]|uniref:TetR/AcrR family transcriptional regulator n=1 Tax=unclassified Shouchella TaxID=2893065 RepID=UPI0039A21B68